MKNKMKLVKISTEEMKKIEGGDWIFELGKNAKKVCCAVLAGTENLDSALYVG